MKTGKHHPQTRTLYLESSGSIMASRRSMPSVMYLMRVAEEEQSSNRTL